MQRLLFSTDTDSGTITAYDFSNQTQPIAKIQIGNGPRGAVRFTKDGRGFVTNHAGNTVSEIDAFSLREVARVTVGIAPIGLAIIPGDKYAIVSNSGDNTVSIVDLGSRSECFTLPVGREPRHPDVMPDGKFAYVPLSGGDTLLKIDVSELAKSTPDLSKVVISSRIFLGQGTMPYSAAVSPKGDKVITANNQVDYISIVDVASDKILHNVNVGSKGARGTAYTPDGSVAFVSIEDISETVAIDVAAGTVAQRLASGPGPRGLLYDAKTQTICVAGFSRTGGAIAMVPNSVSVLHVGATPLTLGAAPAVVSLSVGAGPCSVAMFERQ